MSMGKQMQVLSIYPFFACILRIGLQRKLGLRQPAAQGFDIHSQTKTGLGQRDNGHGTTPFKGRWNTHERQADIFPGKLLRRCWATSKESSQENSWEFS
jgi:hypothetical protein